MPGCPIGQQQGSDSRLAEIRRQLTCDGASVGDRGGGGGDAVGSTKAVNGTRSASFGTGTLRRRTMPEVLVRIGDGRGGKRSRWALPITAFFDRHIWRPISAVVTPPSQSRRSRTVRMSVQLQQSSALMVGSPFFKWVWAVAGNRCRGEPRRIRSRNRCVVPPVQGGLSLSSKGYWRVGDFGADRAVELENVAQWRLRQCVPGLGR